ncbi:MAG: hypothetical protein LM582_04215 [Desulfurococcaceae archaeon]|jgi:hypothetical protein|nr:hypothetical protein [Desulfurococcaceae archaeon]MCC6057448.1 hypothetical protein [Desulfurococcaceae archaeon]
MNFISSLRGKVVLLNILIISMYILTVVRESRTPSIIDIVTLVSLPIVSYIFLRRYAENV